MGYFLFSGRSSATLDAGYSQEVRDAYRLYRAGKYEQACAALEKHVASVGSIQDANARRAAIVRLLPVLTDAIRKGTARYAAQRAAGESLASSERLSFELIRRAVAPIFSEKELRPEARELLSAMRRACDAGYGRQAENPLGGWAACLALTVPHADLDLPGLLRDMERNADIAWALLEFTPAGRQMLMTAPEAGRPPMLEPSRAQEVMQAIASQCMRAVISHATQAPEKNIRELCDQAWPGSIPVQSWYERLARLGKALPALGEQEDFVFGVAWLHAKQVRFSQLDCLKPDDRAAIDPLWDWDLAYYLRKFPKGQHVAMARSGLGKKRASP